MVPKCSWPELPLCTDATEVSDKFHLWQWHIMYLLGKPLPTKMDEFSEKFQTAINPPLIFGKFYCGFRDKSA